MSAHPLPVGCHDAESAAKLLAVSKKQLLKKMRELGWLITGKGAHNLPKREFIHQGWLTTQDRSYRIKGSEIVKLYRVAVITQKGFRELQRIMKNNKNDANFLLAAGEKSALKLETTERRYKAIQEQEADSKENGQQTETEEREKCLAQLREWGLAS